MENLYITIIERLIFALPELKWIDIDKGQMREERPPVAFPCALVNIIMPRCKDLNDTIQHCNALITVSLCFDFTANRTASAYSVEERKKSFEYLALSRKLYQKLQGWEAEGLSPLSRVSTGEPLIRNGYKITDSTFAVEFNDESFQALYLGDNFGNAITNEEGAPIQANQI